jgi:hypothetical protein
LFYFTVRCGLIGDGFSIGKAVLGEWSLKLYGTPTDPSPRYRNQQIALKPREVVDVYNTQNTRSTDLTRNSSFLYNIAPSSGSKSVLKSSDSKSPQAKNRQPHGPGKIYFVSMTSL